MIVNIYVNKTEYVFWHLQKCSLYHIFSSSFTHTHTHVFDILWHFDISTLMIPRHDHLGFIQIMTLLRSITSVSFLNLSTTLPNEHHFISNSLCMTCHIKSIMGATQSERLRSEKKNCLKKRYTENCSRHLGSKHVALFYWAYGQYFGTIKNYYLIASSAKKDPLAAGLFEYFRTRVCETLAVFVPWGHLWCLRSPAVRYDIFWG